MAYCTVAQVQGEFKAATFSASSAVTDTVVGRFIEEADAEIDATLGLKFVTPITGTKSLVMVRQISIELVSQRIKEILAVKAGNSAADQGVKVVDVAELARKRMKAILKGQEITLPDATLVSTNQGVESFDVDNDEEFVFQKGTNQW